MKTGEFGQIGNTQTHIDLEQIHRIYNAIIVHVGPKVLARKPIDGLAQIGSVGMKSIGQILKAEGFHQEWFMLCHIPAAPVIQKLIGRCFFVVV